MKKERLKIKTERIEFFSDAVIAIIITLMVLDIHLPKIEDNATSAQIFHQLKGVLPNIFAFMISFAVLGVYWVNHHQFFKAIEQADWKLLWYNLHFLFWCSKYKPCNSHKKQEKQKQGNKRVNTYTGNFLEIVYKFHSAFFK